MPIAESAIVSSQETKSAHGPYWTPSRGRFALVGLCLFLAYLPLLWIEARFLWDQPQHQSFPLVVLGAIFLTNQRLRRLGSTPPGIRGHRLSDLRLRSEPSRTGTVDE